MKAIVRSKYGSPDVLELREIEKPAVEDDHVLVRVQAASVNAGDWHSMRGKPYIIRLMLGGLFKPRTKNAVLGGDLAGRVEAVGGNVTEFQPGDEVFGMSIRTFAEYVSVRRVGIVRKPANLTFEQAAAVPVAAITALQGLRDKGHIRPGQKVLINGASGGVGTFAVQIAKSFGADVTAVCSPRNVDMVRSLGADRVIDYTREDFTRDGARYDLIFDVAGNHSFSECRRVLSPNGTLVMVGQSGRKKISILPLLTAPLVSRLRRKQKLVSFIAKRNKEDLTLLKELMDAGKVTPVIDRQYTLSEVPAALRYLGEGHARGKIVITV
ncbi:MAG: NAD(P)-dependent alcohol dehydrogenase [Methanobacteriota archaeon]|nr:MAG: NAD(P)-dependent alcohol dehydrogenase [Euryarchaeota archaeon]